ncbi:uncharacterized protein LOC107638961 isoform X1 [Arachis ipaensis]|uniref:uncharacterized protein LOC107638961 isoform X1 n=1 Tax=Arachis ipaensis TaxID=130454 RepID=UPI000A2B63F0|nr:uncharacterized protein LOC107638961 isoform X1 [Arachis ipaensis]
MLSSPLTLSPTNQFWFGISFTLLCTIPYMVTSPNGPAPLESFTAASSSINLKISGRKAYMRYLDNIYKQNDISWFTPVEIFKPWYAHAIAEAIMRTANFSVPLKIYEIGGGSGTCAKGILDYIMLNAPPKVYNSMTYTSVEISPSLAEVQRETVGEVRSHIPKFRVECRDAADRRGWGDVERQPCWVIMLEVLDNLPHDLVYSENQVSPWMEVWVERQHGRETLGELYKPLQDPLITRCVEIMDMDEPKTTRSAAVPTLKGIWSKVYPKPRRCWLPTGCLKLLEVLHEVLPKMSLIASDFSYLPDVKVPGERAPLVSTKKDGSSSDYENYMDAKVWFPISLIFQSSFFIFKHILKMKLQVISNHLSH